MEAAVIHVIFDWFCFFEDGATHTKNKKSNIKDRKNIVHIESFLLLEKDTAGERQTQDSAYQPFCAQARYCQPWNT